MISSELAKELIDAGMPEGVILFRNKNGKQGYYIELDLLIGACGDRFSSLYRNRNSIRFDRWTAELSNEKWEIEKHIGGDSPEEAVIKLWLALNKK